MIGRGLRRVRGQHIDPNEPQICAIVDHPKLEHQWLWDIFNAKKRENVSIDDLFDETEDLPPPLPKQELTKPHLVIRVPDPDPRFIGDGEFEVEIALPAAEPLRNWQEVLRSIQYEPEGIEITRVDIEEVRGKELGGEGWETHMRHTITREKGEVYVANSDDALRDAIKARLLEIAEELLDQAGYAPIEYKGTVYQALIEHVREKILNGATLGASPRAQLEFAWRMLPQVKQKLQSIPGLIAGIIEYGD